VGTRNAVFPRANRSIIVEYPDLQIIYFADLRMTNNSVKIMSIPKIGYKHINLREGSIFWNYKNGDDNLTDEEVRFWVESAKKEYFFINDRAIKYEPQTV
jgi:hypothetical protein